MILNIVYVWEDEKARRSFCVLSCLKHSQESATADTQQTSWWKQTVSPLVFTPPPRDSTPHRSHHMEAKVSNSTENLDTSAAPSPSQEMGSDHNGGQKMFHGQKLQNVLSDLHERRADRCWRTWKCWLVKIPAGIWKQKKDKTEIQCWSLYELGSPSYPCTPGVKQLPLTDVQLFFLPLQCVCVPSSVACRQHHFDKTSG